MFGTTTRVIQGNSQNPGFGIFEQNVRISNSEWQPFGSLGEGSLLVGNSNFNNLPPVSLFENLRGGNFNNLSPPPTMNLFGNLGGGNLSLNNNNPSGGLDPNVTALVNALIRMNLTEGHYLREGSFIKLTEFGGTETEDPNEWLERFNKIVKAN